MHENIPSKVRNPLILKTLFLSEDVESYSSGLKRVYSECEKNNINIDYVTGREGFTFIFKRNVVNSVVNSVVNTNLSVDEEMVINIIKDNPNYSSETISKLINKSSRSVQRILAELKKKEFIERIGGTRGYWKVNR